MKQRNPLIILFLFLLTIMLIGSIVGMFLRILNEIRISLEFFIPSWIVSPVLFIIFVLLITLIIQNGLPWIKNFIRSQRYIYNKNNRYKIPKSSQQAARNSINSIEGIIDKLQDTVKREGLQLEKENLARELNRRDLRISVFGSGSSGKTSLIRGLLKEIVGEVGAPMGSTAKSNTYRLRLKGIQRGIQLIDTPGLFEGGKDGIYREKEARVIASKSDLIIVVIDSDLRSVELEAIFSLNKLGKRLLLILNKCDLRGEDEVKRLKDVLSARCKGVISNDDIISTSASPQSIPRPGLKPLQPPIEIENLLAQLSRIIHIEGDELLADNLLLQCRNLGNKGRRLLNSQRFLQANKCVEKYGWISSGVVLATPLPVVDLLGAAAVNGQMIIEIAKIYGIKINKNRAQELAKSIGKTLAGLGIVKGSISIISTAMTISAPTLILSRIIQSIATAWLTRIAGASIITYFEQDQDWGDGGMQEVVQNHFNLNKRKVTLNSFLKIALKKSIEPLSKDQKKQLPPLTKPLEEEVTLDLENLEK